MRSLDELIFDYLDESFYNKYIKLLDRIELKIKNFDKTVSNIEYKISHRHPYDSSDTDDLIKDIISQHKPSYIEMAKRKMKYSYKTIIYFLAAFIFAMSFASVAFAFTVPNKPENGFYIVDTANKLSSVDMSNLNHKIENFNTTTRNEIGVLIIPTLGDANIEDASNDVFNKWGIGKAGLDNGILLMIAANDHKMRIETGKGSEGDVPDAIAHKLTGDMKPFLRKNDYAGAINVVIDGITSVMESRVGQKPIVDNTSVSTQSSSNDDSIYGIILISMVGGVIFILWLLNRRSRFDYQIATYDPTYSTEPTHRSPSISPPYVAPTSHHHKAKSSYIPSSSSEPSTSPSSDSSFGSDIGGGFGGGSSGGGGSSDSW